MKGIYVWLLAIVVLAFLTLSSCTAKEKSFTVNVKTGIGNNSASAGSSDEGPSKVVEKMLQTIKSGDLKGAENFMTDEAKNLRFPMGSEKWADEIADLIDKSWRVENSEISGSTARVEVAVTYQEPYCSYDKNGLPHVQILNKERIWVFVLEKENGKWMFARIPEYY